MNNKSILALVLLFIFFSFSCAQKENDRYIKCAVYIKLDENGKRINGFWDLERKEEVNVSDCDEIYPANR
jgi:hypothetical protein